MDINEETLMTSADALTRLAMDGGTELREGYAEIGDVTLHYVEAGDGPLVVLLHGFPEFWYGWRLQIEPLAAAGFRVVAPDMRGYNLSSKPDGVAAYDTRQLATDIRGLVHERGAESALIAGHDWGGSVAWANSVETTVRGSSSDTVQRSRLPAIFSETTCRIRTPPRRRGFFCACCSRAVVRA